MIAMLSFAAALLAASPTATPARIVTLGGGITATVDALGLGDRIVAVDASSPAPGGRPQTPRVGYYRQISAEGILALRPELILGPAGTGPDVAVKQIGASGVRFEQLTDVKTVAGAAERITAIGRIVGQPAKAAELVAQMNAALKRAASRAAGKTKPKVLFIFVHGGATLQVAGAGTAAQTMIEAAGGTNAVSGYRGYRPLTPEAAVLARPDVILATPRSLGAVGGAAGLWTNPGLMATPAGQARRLVVIPDVDLLGFGPATGDAVETLAKALFP